MVKFIRYQKLFRMYEKIQPFLKYSMPVEDKLPGNRALVLAPHPDDESVGCGGTLYKHSKAGGKVDFVFCTSGSDEREQEASAAVKLLGADSSVFWQKPIQCLSGQKDLPLKLINVFEDKKPDVVFIPFWLDNHVDHRAINEALVTAAEKKKFSFMIYAYPVWFPVYPNVLIDISGEAWEQKKKAISCYKSQLAARDYITMSSSLGQYWAQVKGRGMEVVETFFRATFAEYVKLSR